MCCLLFLYSELQRVRFFLLHYHPQILFLKLFARCLKNDFVCHVSNLDHGKSERGRTKNFPVVFLVEKTK